MQLTLFPASLSDELFVSRVSRYHILSGNRTTRETYAALFNSAPFSLTYWIPPHLGRLAARLPGDPDSNLHLLLHENTLFPLFRIFAGVSIGYEHAAGRADFYHLGCPKESSGKAARHTCAYSAFGKISNWRGCHISIAPTRYRVLRFAGSMVRSWLIGAHIVDARSKREKIFLHSLGVVVLPANAT